MHDLWYMVAQTAKITDADDAGQDQLVTLILYARECGTISRKVLGHFEEMRTSDGLVWTDLPYLVLDLQEFGLKSTELTATHRRNFAAFTARLTALGIADLSSYALWLFRETLEVNRPMVQSEKGEALPTAELLPACLAWLQYASHKLLRLSFENYCPATSDHASLGENMASLGELTDGSGIERAGFSIIRWVFWRQMIVELTQCQDQFLVSTAQDCLQLMQSKGRELGLEVPGEIDPYEDVRS